MRNEPPRTFTQNFIASGKKQAAWGFQARQEGAVPCCQGPQKGLVIVANEHPAVGDGQDGDNGAAVPTIPLLFIGFAKALLGRSREGGAWADAATAPTEPSEA